MTNFRNLTLNNELYDYLLKVSLREETILQRLREEIITANGPLMQSSPEQTQFMVFLSSMINAHKIIEIGVYKGYSTLALALALPADGQIVACDINKEWTDVGRRYWHEAGVEHKINLHIAPALETLESLIKQGQTNSFDFAFIDADKKNYDLYYEKCLDLVRSGGLILIDNTLWLGKVADLKINDSTTLAIRALNIKLKEDKRINISLLPIRDGLTLIHKK